MDEVESGQMQDQRTLASIMFTDVVGFSKLTAINEDRTMRALNRDFDLLFRSISAYKGEVLNTMGDGMMVYFPSATQCMQCALDIQQTLHALKMSNPPDGILSHRIGLNIGEIHLNGRNTMGDGVNQAARIQSMAKPDSIKMSADFYRLVKDKVKMDAKYVPGQMAKNIPVPIPTYEVAAIDEMLKLQVAESLFTPPTAADGLSGATGRRGVLMLVLALIMIAVAAVPIYMMSQAKRSTTSGLAKFGKGRSSPSEAAAIRDKVRSGLGGGKAATAKNEPEVDSNTPETATVKFALTPDEMNSVEQAKSTFAFEEVVSLLKAHPGIADVSGQEMLRKYEALVALKGWLSAEVAAATQEKPLALSVGGQQADIYSTPAGVVVITNGQESSPKSVWQLKPETLEAAGISAAAMPPTGSPAPQEVVSWLATFREIYRLG